MKKLIFTVLSVCLLTLSSQAQSPVAYTTGTVNGAICKQCETCIDVANRTALQPVVFTCNPQNLKAPYSFKWSTGATTQSITVTPQYGLSVNTISYSCVATGDSAGTTISKKGNTVFAHIQYPPTISVTQAPGSGSVLCNGTYTQQNQMFAMKQWVVLPTPQSQSQSSSSVTFSVPAASGTFQVIGVSGNGCVGSTTTVVK